MAQRIYKYFETVARKDPDAIALQLEDGRFFSYRSLSFLVQDISTILSTLQDDGRCLVAVMMSRDVGFIASILAVLNCEAAYVPVDPSFPPDRKAHIFSHSQCSVLLTDRESHKSALGVGIDLPPCILIESNTGKIISDTLPVHSDTAPFDSKPFVKRPREPEDLAYVLYTSGSTGKPKGVMVKNRSVMNVVNWFAEELGCGTHSRY